MYAKGDDKTAYKILPRAIDISQAMAKQLCDRLIENNVDFIVAPYEADAQISYLVRNGFAHYAISEDSDLILYGCDCVLYKLDKEFNGVLFRQANLLDCLGNEADKFDFRKFKRMCILSGCDYLSNLSGVGLMKAKKFFATIESDNIEKSLPQLPKILNMKKLIVPKEYITKFIEAENVFDHQLVFCPREKKLKPFSDYGENHIVEELHYAGSYFDENLALNLAFGNVCFETMKIFDDTLMDKLEEKYFKASTSIWSETFELKNSSRFDEIIDNLTPSFEKPNELLYKRKYEDEDRAFEDLIKDKKRKTSNATTIEADSSVFGNLFSVTNEKNNSITSNSQESHIEVKSRFFAQSTSEKQNDIQKIKQNREAIRHSLSKLYPKKIIASSQSSTDSGFYSSVDGSQQSSQS